MKDQKNKLCRFICTAIFDHFYQGILAKYSYTVTLYFDGLF